jgi:hypothetical protein
MIRIRASLGLTALGVAHAVGFALLVWWLLPRPELHARSVAGVPELVTYGSARTTDSAIRIGSLLLGCSAAAVASTYSCPKAFFDGVPARATYFEMRTLEARLGLADAPLVLLRLEQRGEVVHERSGDALRSQYLRTGLVIPICLFVASFLGSVKLMRRAGSKGGAGAA